MFQTLDFEIMSKKCSLHRHFKLFLQILHVHSKLLFAFFSLNILVYVFFLSVTIGFIVLTVCVIVLIIVPLLILLMRNSSPSFLKQRCSSSSPLADVTQKLCEDGETNYSVQTDGYAAKNGLA